MLKMNSLIATVILVTYCSVTPGRQCYGFERDYVERAVLTEEQEKTVLELAKKRGIKKVGKIYTYNIYPTAARGIGVRGIEQIKDRDVSCEVLMVTYGKWSHAGVVPGKDDLKIGDFWAGKPRTEKQKILKIGKDEFRVGRCDGMKPAECEAILKLLLSKQYVGAPGVRSEEFQHINFRKPNWFSKRGETCQVSFTRKKSDSEWFHLTVKIEDGKVVISELLQLAT